MGKSMAGHLLAGGHELHVFNSSRAKADDLLARGAIWHDAPGEIAAICDVVITIVGYPYVSRPGRPDRQGATRCHPHRHDHLQPVAGTACRRSGLDHGCQVLDAPVSGGDVGAHNANLATMVGGDAEALECVMPLLALTGSNIAHQGAAGAGQHTKMANQIAIASTMMAVGESLAYAKHAGLDRNASCPPRLGTGAAASFLLSNLGPRMLDGDFAPGFFVRHFFKDMEIAIVEADRMKLDLPGLARAKALYSRLIDAEFEDEGTQALFRIYAGID
jgi:3-hydroxyisobutyrate dehydrogenase